LDLVEALVDGNLLQHGAQPDGESRFGMLATVREFALEQLIAHGEEATTRAAHAAYLLERVDRAQPELWAAAGPALLDRLAIEHDNLRAALSWAVTHEPETALRLTAGLWRFWHKTNHWTEGRAWLERALAAGADQISLTRANALAGAGAIATEQGDFEPAGRFLQESLDLADQLGDALAAARALRGLGILASNRGDLEPAAALFERALARFRAIPDQAGIARCLNDLGLVADRRGDKEQAIAYEEEALPIVRASGDQWFAGVILGNLGSAYYERGDYERGQALTEEALAVSRLVGDTFGEAVNSYNLGNCVMQLGDPAGAIARYRQALALTRQLGEKQLATRILDRLAIALLAAGQPRPAVHLFGAAAALREASGDQLFVDEQRPIDTGHGAARDELGAVAFAEAWATGRSLSLEQATALAARIEIAPPAPAKTIARSPVSAGLTPREIEVLRLLVEGRTDKEIAAELDLSRRAASRHVATILGKLGAPSRTAAATLALRDRLV
jgi:tetratricopeptide (TPR) repeat protein